MSDPTPAWGHAGGFLDLSPPRPLVGAEAVADRLMILDRLHRYAWGYDERRADLLRECFWEDGVWEGDVMGRTPIGPFEGVERIVSWLADFWPVQRDQRRHMFLTPVVEDQEPASATVVSYMQLLGASDASVRLETTAFYRVRMRKAEGLWRIAHLFAGFDAPFWPGKVEELSPRARTRHGIAES